MPLSPAAFFHIEAPHYIHTLVVWLTHFFYVFPETIVTSTFIYQELFYILLRTYDRRITQTRGQIAALFTMAYLTFYRDNSSALAFLVDYTVVPPNRATSHYDTYSRRCQQLLIN